MEFKSGMGGGSSSAVIKLKDGQSVTGVLRGNPFEFESAFKPGDKPKYRFRLNMVFKVDGVLQAQILEGGWKLSCQLKELLQSGWDLEKTRTRISRTGSGINDTVYSATVLPTPIPSPELAEILKVSLLDLTPPQAITPRIEVPPGPLAEGFGTW